MQITSSRTIAMVLGAAVGVLGLAGCSGETAPAKPAPSSQPADAVEETPEAEAPKGDGTRPDWANPGGIVGDLISTIKVNDITVEVYQVSVVAATKKGNFVDPKDNKPIIDVGDDIVFVNYVITNSGAPIDLGASLVSVQARYADWPYVQGMDAITDSALYEAQGVSSNPMAPGSFRDPSIYTFGTGETYSYAQNFRYQASSPINFKVGVTPIDASGKLIHDKKAEGEGTGTIK